MSRQRPIIDIVAAYARSHGCVIFDGKDTWLSRDKTRSVRFSEARDREIIVWDTGTPLGWVPLPREERRLEKAQDQPEDQGDKAVPGEGDGKLRMGTLVGQDIT